MSLLEEFDSSPTQHVETWRSLLGVMSSLTRLVPSPLVSPATASCSGVARQGPRGHRVIVKTSKYAPRLRPHYVEPPTSPAYRRVGRRLRRDARRRCRLGALAGGTSPLAHKSQGTPGSRTGHTSVPSHPPRQGRTVVLRQRNDSGFPEEGGRHSLFSLNQVAQRILRLCEQYHIILRHQFVAGTLNVLAGALSRTPGPGVRVDSPSRRGSRPLSSLASDGGSLCHQSQSPAPTLLLPCDSPMTVGVNAMLHPWDHLEACTFPPFGLIPQVLEIFGPPRAVVSPSSLRCGSRGRASTTFSSYSSTYQSRCRPDSTYSASHTSIIFTAIYPT